MSGEFGKARPPTPLGTPITMSAVCASAPLLSAAPSAPAPDGTPDAAGAGWGAVQAPAQPGESTRVPPTLLDRAPAYERAGTVTVDTREAARPASDALKLLLGKRVEDPLDEAPIDQGFPPQEKFHHGVVTFVEGKPAIVTDAPSASLGTKVGASILTLLTCGLALPLGTAWVQQGQVGIVQDYFGRTRVVGPGWHIADVMFKRSVTKMSMNDALNAAVTTTSAARAGAGAGALDAGDGGQYRQIGNAHIIRVPQACVGRAVLGNEPILLGPGWHTYTDPLFTWHGIAQLTVPHFTVGTTLHYIVVDGTQIATATVGGKGHFLGAGTHLFNNPRFEFDARTGIHDARKRYINVGSMHRVFVPRGKLQPVLIAGAPFILPEGVHNISVQQFELVGDLADATDWHIAVGSLHRFNVTADVVVAFVVRGQGYILHNAGEYYVNDPTFALVGSGRFPYTTEHVAAGTLHRVFVAPQRLVAYKLRQRGFIVDTPGVFTVDDPAFVWVGGYAFTAGYTGVGTLARLYVAPNCVGAYTLAERGFIVDKPGVHWIADAASLLPARGGDYMYPASSPLIHAGDRARIVVPSGKVAKVVIKGEAKLLDRPGVELLDDAATLVYEPARDEVGAAESYIQHGHIHRMNVPEGTNGVFLDGGKLDVLAPGTTTRATAAGAYCGTVSLAQRTVLLREVTTTTRDNMNIRYDAQLCARVVNAKLAITRLCPQGFSETALNESIKSMFVLALDATIAAQPFNNRHVATVAHATAFTKTDGSKLDDATYAQAVSDDATGGAGAGVGGPGAEAEDPAATVGEQGGQGFRTTIATVFAKRFNDMLSACGVELVLMAMGNVEVLDEAVHTATLAAAESRAKYDSALIENATALAKAKNQATVAAAKAKGEAEAKRIAAQGDADAEVARRTAEANGIRLVGDATAAAISAKADAMSRVPPAMVQQELMERAATAMAGAAFNTFNGVDPLGAAMGQLLGVGKAVAAHVASTVTATASRP